MTLAEVQEIGREVGIPDELVAQAALRLPPEGGATRQRWLGLPIGVSRTVELPREMSRKEWERVVADLRETFAAKGTLSETGNLRQWTNGNLQVFLEPTASGQRLRMRTAKADTRAAVIVGLASAIPTTGLMATALSRGVDDLGAIIATSLLAVSGIGLAISTVVRLPRWARTRRQQMDQIATRLLTMLEEPVRTAPEAVRDSALPSTLRSPRD